MYRDVHGNTVRRFDLPAANDDPSRLVRHAVFAPGDAGRTRLNFPVREMSEELLRYTLPTRYCDSDRLMDFAYREFGQVPHGLQRVERSAIDPRAYRISLGLRQPAHDRLGGDRPRFGICRDFAMWQSRCAAVSICPPRYVTGHLPDVACHDPGAPMDFHAYFQVYFGGIGTPMMPGSMSPASGASTSRAASTPWTAPSPALRERRPQLVRSVELPGGPEVVKLGDPVDLAKRLDGEKTMRFA